MNKVYTGSYTPPEQHGATTKPERIIGYELEVFSYKNLFWHPRKKNYLVPGGLLKSVTRIDIGTLVADFFLSAAIPRGFSYAQGKAIFPGKKSKARPYLLPKEMREFEHFVDLSLLCDQKEFLYQFELKKESVTIDHPLEFKVSKYISESYDSEKENVPYDTAERIVPWFKRLNKNNFPHPADFYLKVFPEVEMNWN